MCDRDDDDDDDHDDGDGDNDDAVVAPRRLLRSAVSYSRAVCDKPPTQTRH
ncbi:MAG: hypothetical protein ACK53L_20235 [Pirellulaceae bacterium]